MITRRGFFGTVAALVVGGGAARLRLTPKPGTWAAIEHSTFPAWRAQVPTTHYAFSREALQRIYDNCQREGPAFFQDFATYPWSVVWRLS